MIAAVIDYYRQQAQLLWSWRATRVAMARRLVLSFLMACLALAVAADFLVGLGIGDLAELVAAGLALSILNALARPLFLWLFAPLPIFVAQGAQIVFMVAVLLGIGRILPGVRIAGLESAAEAALVVTLVVALLSELVGVSDDDSTHGTLVRQQVARHRNEPTGGRPGLLIVQIDGLGLPVLEGQMRAGRMPVLARLVRSGDSTLQAWEAMLPSVTPASQAGILHGRNDDIPGFRWYEKAARRMMVANHPHDAELILERLSDGSGLLADGGVSVGNLLTGDASHSYLTMATIETAAPRDRRLRGFFVSTVNYVRLLVLMVGEFVKELYQAERQRSSDIRPRVARGFRFAAERAVTNIALRTVSTALVIEELYARAPIVYVDYTGYDAIAHHSGPERPEATDALEGIDRAIGTLLKAAETTNRPYRLVVLSDHGQSLGTTFRQRHGEGLEGLVARLLGPHASVASANDVDEYRGQHRIGREARRRAGVQPRGGSAGGAPSRGASAADVVVCASGSLAHLYVTVEAGRMDAESIERAHPGLIDGLARHPGVAVLMVGSATEGMLLRRGSLSCHLDDASPERDQILRGYGADAAASLSRLAGFSNRGDIVLLGPFDQGSGELESYEELVGSHGGLGGWQTHGFLLHPVRLIPDKEPLVGAPALYRQLLRWRSES